MWSHSLESLLPPALAVLHSNEERGGEEVTIKYLLLQVHSIIHNHVLTGLLFHLTVEETEAPSVGKGQSWAKSGTV